MDLKEKKKRLKRRALTIIWAIVLLWLAAGALYLYNSLERFDIVPEPETLEVIELYYGDIWSGNEIIYKDNSWEVDIAEPFEFSGTVRHIERYEDDGFPMITHDLVLGTGEFAKKERSSVSVINHDLYYNKRGNILGGQIFFAHVLSNDKMVLDKLDTIEKFQEITITGNLVNSLTGFNQGNNGNIVLVKSVEVKS